MKVTNLCFCKRTERNEFVDRRRRDATGAIASDEPCNTYVSPQNVLYINLAHTRAYLFGGERTQASPPKTCLLDYVVKLTNLSRHTKIQMNFPLIRL